MNQRSRARNLAPALDMNPQSNFPATLTRRSFLTASTAVAFSSSMAAPLGRAEKKKRPASGSHEVMRELFHSLSAEQRRAVCFDWDYRVDIEYNRKPLYFAYPKGVLLRTHMANAWKITPQLLASDFYTDSQRALVLEVMKTVMAPGWTEKLQQQAEDDYGGAWGEDQAIAFFGAPDQEHFQCLVTGFHLTLRAGSGHDTSSAFGGGIAHGHQPSGFFEKAGHPGNIWWYQSKLANAVYALLDEKQRSRARVKDQVPCGVTDPAVMADLDRQLRNPTPKEIARVDALLRKSLDRTTVRPGVERDDRREAEIRFRGPKGPFPGLPIAEMGREQREAVDKMLAGFLEPYREEYRSQVMRCLKKQGGIEACSMAFYEQFDMGADGEWDVWRVEGPSFVWFFRGAMHVHLWIHIADDPAAPVSSYFG
jgi:hypothetical protein